jgi:predicted lipid-binding transport protein (Tim44 family)
MQVDPYIVVYAIIAVLILARLWKVLGRRNDTDTDTERPDPFGAPVPSTTSKFNPFSSGKVLTEGVTPKFAHPPQSLMGKLEQIKSVDAVFDEKAFLRGAKDAFGRIVAAFAAGDLSPVVKLLGPKVAPHFQAAIDARKSANQTMKSSIARFKDAETIAAELSGTLAVITVRFVSDQENILRDASGRVIGGAEGKVEEITDVWSFSRDLKSDNPDWMLVETKS